MRFSDSGGLHAYGDATPPLAERRMPRETGTGHRSSTDNRRLGATARFREDQPPATPIGLIRHDGDEPVTLSRQDIAPHGGPIHDQFGSQRIDSHWPTFSKVIENRELGRADSDFSEEAIIKLRDMPRRLPHREAVAVFQFSGFWRLCAPC